MIVFERGSRGGGYPGLIGHAQNFLLLGKANEVVTWKLSESAARAKAANGFRIGC